MRRRIQVFILLAGIPVEGTSSECMEYRMIILIIIIISLGQICYRTLQTHHACTHAHSRTHVHTHSRRRRHLRRTSYRYSVSPNRAIQCRPTVTVRSDCDNAERWLFK